MRLFLTLFSMVILGQLAWQHQTLAQSTPGTIPLALDIPCPGGGHLTVNGSYNSLTSAIAADISFDNCSYRNSTSTETLSGTVTLNGMLPLANGTLDLSISTTSLTSTTSLESSTTHTTVCSGNIRITGTVDDGHVNAQHSSQLNCQGSGSTNGSMERFINGILKADYF